MADKPHCCNYCGGPDGYSVNYLDACGRCFKRSKHERIWPRVIHLPNEYQAKFNAYLTGKPKPWQVVEEDEIPVDDFTFYPEHFSDWTVAQCLIEFKIASGHFARRYER